MIPLSVSAAELGLAIGWVRDVDAELTAKGVDFGPYLAGTMVETPRAALVADEIAEVAEFFSFGTNDLTQMTFGFSRDDVEGRFMSQYLEQKLLTREPVRDPRRRRGRRARPHRGRAGPERPARPQARHLRRARRRPCVGAVLPRDRPRLRVVLAVPGAPRSPRRGARRARRRRSRHHGLTVPAFGTLAGAYTPLSVPKRWRMEAMTERVRATVFGEVADLYQRARPSYPVGTGRRRARSRSRRNDRACSRWGAARGRRRCCSRRTSSTSCASNRMPRWRRGAAGARRTSRTWRSSPGVSRTGCRATTRFDLVISAQAWHWVEPDAGSAQRARSARRRRRHRRVLEPCRLGG